MSFAVDGGTAAGTGQPRILARGIEKWYGGVHALAGVDFAVRSATVHALLGQNGSGKSTLIKAISGEIQPSGGEIEIDGVTRTIDGPREAREAGIAVVGQELPLVPTLSVGENIAGGMFPRIRGVIDWARVNEQARQQLAVLELDCDPKTLVEDLSLGDQQIVAIARALSAGARILLLDEPTSALTAHQAQRVFELIRRLKGEGVGIVYVSQRLPDIYAVADEVTVLRDGRVAGSMPIAEATTEEITHLMLGRVVSLPPRRASLATDALLQASGLTLEPHFRGVDLTMCKGEVVGLAGVAGCGRSEVLLAIAGALSGSTGSLELEGKPIVGWSLPKIVDAGIGLVPTDRKRQGLVLTDTVQQNLLMARSCGLSLRPLHMAREGKLAVDTARSLLIPTDRMDLPTRTLSGGNQQKVLLGKWLIHGLKALLMDEPTRGVDIGARHEIYQIIVDLASSGLGLLISSSENDELAAICDRVIVMYGGFVVGHLQGEDATEETITRLAMGGDAPGTQAMKAHSKAAMRAEK